MVVKAMVVKFCNFNPPKRVILISPLFNLEVDFGAFKPKNKFLGLKFSFEITVLVKSTIIFILILVH